MIRKLILEFILVMLESILMSAFVFSAMIVAYLLIGYLVFKPLGIDIM